MKIVNDYVWTEDGETYTLTGEITGMMKVRIFPEQIEALSQRFGSPVVKIALDTVTNVVWEK